MADAPPIAVAQILQSNAAFANKLYQILAKKAGNVFFSPFSVHAVICMAYQGAQRETAKILSRVLGIPDAKTTATGYKYILNGLKSNEELVLNSENKIYLRDGEEILEGFQSDVKEYFGSEVEVLNFKKKGETARKINEWVKLKTKEKIKEVVDESMIEHDTAMFLLNAIYFEAEWQKHFSASSTRPAPFYIDGDNTVEVQMMKGRKTAYYGDHEALDAEILALPYQDRKADMIIILPKTRTGIEDLELKLASFDLSQLANGLRSVTVNISLPKFVLETAIPLEDVLKEMGLEIIFDKMNANFRGMVKLRPDENLCVDKVLQKAYIDVSEKGTEAAAVTVMLMRKQMMAVIRERIINFVVDHPAIFMIVAGEETQKNILFCGRLSRPTV